MAGTCNAIPSCHVKNRLWRQVDALESEPCHLLEKPLDYGTSEPRMRVSGDNGTSVAMPHCVLV